MPTSAPSTPAPTPAPAAGAVPLAWLRPGQTAVIAAASLDADDAALLRAMGLADRVRIKVCRVGEPCVVALGSVEGKHCHCHGHCRIGLARTLARRILVTVVA